jgi:hypothetical protein
MSALLGLRPLFLVKPGSVSKKDIRRVEKLCGICMVECSDPDAARYSEPPLGADLNEQARAALSLMRRVMSMPGNFSKADLMQWFINELITWKTPEKVPPVPQGKRATA